MKQDFSTEPTKRFVPERVAKPILGVKTSALRRMADLGLIASFRTAGGHRRYDVDGYVARVRRSAANQND